MKIQNQAPAQTSAAPTSAPASAPASAGQASGSVQGQASQLGKQFKDEFVQGRPGGGIIDNFPVPLPDRVTMSLKDHVTASKLPETLSNPLNDDLLAAGDKDVGLSRDGQGVWRGPEGQPLAQVKLEDGTTAYVDPNTNQYYLTDEHGFFGHVNALGPLDLPEGAQFSNSHFSDADVRSIQKGAGNGPWFPRPIPIDPLPLPRPFPPIDPMPLPFPRPLPVDPWGPIRQFDPSDLLAAGAGKAPGNE